MSTDERIGLIVENKYRIESLIAEGGMGRVYRAAHLRLGEPVVVKFLLPEWAAHPELRTRFQREAQILARLQHPGIVTVFDLGEHAGTPFIVMELLRGNTLDSVLCRSGAPLPNARLGVIFDQILQVLEASHRAGVVHRDLKPENVMLLDSDDEVDRIKVLDFGVAYVVQADPTERLTQAGSVPGTPTFMSPEQGRGTEVGPASDIYSLGVMMYEALAGEAPFGGRTGMDIITKHMFSPPPPIGDRGWLITPAAGLEALVMRTLAKDPRLRPDATTLREELQIALAELDPASRAERAGAERVARASLDRSQRTLTEPMVSMRRELEAEATVVMVSGSDADRCNELCLVLAVNGFRADYVAPQRLLEDPADTARQVMLLVQAQPDIELLVTRLRARWGATPIVVFDVADPARIPALIRADVSDVAIAGLADGLLCRRLQRLRRRKP